MIFLELNAYKPPDRNDFFNYSGVIDNYGSNKGVKINDGFIDPYLFLEKYFMLDGILYYNDDYNDTLIYDFVTHNIYDQNQDLQIENGIFTSYLQSYFDNMFGNSKYTNNTDFINALIRTRTKYYNWYVKAKAEYENALAEWRERQENDMAPVITIDGFEIVLSFVMNQDDTFSVNMMETYTDVTLNCFDDLEVRYNAGNSDNAQNILNYIYRGFRPDLF